MRQVSHTSEHIQKPWNPLCDPFPANVLSLYKQIIETPMQPIWKTVLKPTLNM